MRRKKQMTCTNKENPENYTPRYWPKNSVVNEQNRSILQDVRIFRMVENVWTFLRVCLSGTVDPFITPWSRWLSNSRRERGEVTGHRSCATFVNHHPFTFPPFLKWMHYESVSFWSWDLPGYLIVLHHSKELYSQRYSQGNALFKNDLLKRSSLLYHRWCWKFRFKSANPF